MPNNSPIERLSNFRNVATQAARNYASKEAKRKKNVLYEMLCAFNNRCVVFYQQPLAKARVSASRFSSDRKLNEEREENKINYIAYNNNKTSWGLLLSRK